MEKREVTLAHKTNMYTRVTCIHGTAQLLTAVSALKELVRIEGTKSAARDLLLVYNLACRGETYNSLSQAIMLFAQNLWTWDRIVFLNDDMIDESTQHPDRATRHIQEELQINAADVVLMCRDSGLGDQTVINAIPTQTRICYGDGIGFYAPKAYLASHPAAQGRLSMIKSYIHYLINSCRRVNNRTTQFNFGIMPAAFAVGYKPPFPTQHIPFKTVKSTYQAAAELIPPSKIEHFYKTNPNNLSRILLTSTQSEWGRITLTSEIEAYKEWLLSIPKSDCELLIKSHPREEVKKIFALTEALNAHGLPAKLLPADIFGPIPFELILLRMECDLHQSLKTTLTVSSAALSLAYLFDCEILVGFGSSVSKKYFSTSYIKTQLKHERTLRNSIRSIRKQRRDNRL